MSILEKYFKEWEISEDDYDIERMMSSEDRVVCELGHMKEDGPRWKKDDRVVVRTAAVCTDYGVARELLIPCAVKLDGVFPFYGYVRTGEKLTLVSQFIGKQSLENIITSRLARTSVFSWNNQKFAKAAYKIAKVMSVLHEMGFIYDNLRPENIVFDGRYNPFFSVNFRSVLFDELPAGPVGYSGYKIYRAPERLRDYVHDKKDDVYAFGMTLYMYFRNPELRYEDGTRIASERQHIRNISCGIRFEKPKDIPECYWQLITRCWAGDPDDRPSFDEICEEMEANPAEFSLAPEKIKGVPNRIEIKRYTDHIKSLKGLACVLNPKMRLAMGEMNGKRDGQNRILNIPL